MNAFGQPLTAGTYRAAESVTEVATASSEAVKPSRPKISVKAENDCVPVSMKNDWTTIYGEGVKKK